MESRDFEKEVKKRLEELQISPPEPVWDYVSKNIESPRKKRRWILLLAFLVLTTGGYLFLKNNHSPKENNGYTKTEKIKTDDLNPSSSHTQHLTIPKKNQEQSTEKTEGTLSSKSERENESHLNSTQTTQKKSGKKEILHADLNPPANSLSVIDKNVDRKNSDQANLSFPSSEKTAYPPIPTPSRIQLQTLRAVMVGSTPLSPYSVTPFHKEDKKPATQKNHPWKWSLHADPGISMSGKGIFSLSENKSYLADLSNAPSPGNVTGPGPVRQPPVFKNKTGIAIGFNAIKEFSEGMGISAGIQYKLNSIESKVGNPVQSGQYTSVNYLNTYTNHFHFIELPVHFFVTSGLKNKIPLRWETGLRISRLIASDALQLDSGIYRKNNKSLTRTGIGLDASVSLPLFSNNQFELIAGPFANYQINKMASEGLFGASHLSFIGLKAEIIFNRKATIRGKR
ncbi:MAG: hypothetical protein J0H55_04060 [Chitinophagaceae bacterium]|nr:hypothetical protein [Chitinophagaceae bacterium]